MKKIIAFSLIAALSLALVAPSLAEEASSERGVGAGRGQSGSLRDLRERQVARYLRRLVTLNGELKEVRGTSAPTELVVKVRNVVPRKNARWSGSYPAAGNELVVKVSASTRIVREFMGKSSFEELTVGDRLRIVAKTNEDGTISASLVQNTSIRATFRVHTGLIQSIDTGNSSFVMRQARRDVFVKTAGNTKIILADGVASTFANLTAGDKVHVRGIINRRTNKIDASLVRVSPRATPLPATTSPSATTSTTPATTPESSTISSTPTTSSTTPPVSTASTTSS